MSNSLDLNEVSSSLIQAIPMESDLLYS